MGKIKHKIKFQIQKSGGPYPHECWHKITSSNGRIYLASEIMGIRNARRVIKNIIDAVKEGRFTIVELEPRNHALKAPKKK